MDIAALFSQLVEFLKQNHFASGGLLVGLTGCVVAVLRHVPERIFAYLWRQFSLEVVVRSDNDLFDAIEYWMARKNISNRTRVFAAQYRFTMPNVGESDANDVLDDAPTTTKKPAGLEMAPGVGNHWLWFNGRPILLQRTQESSKNSMTYSHRPRERFTLYFFGRSSVAAQAFLQAAIDFCNPPENKLIRIFSVSDGAWRVSSANRVRAAKTVVLREGLLDQLTADLRKFFGRQMWYTDLGIPYRRGYLFTGPPGNGKTTTVQVLAGIFQAPVCLLDLANPQLTDERLRMLMNSAPAGAFFLLEDIDALFRKRGPQSRPRDDDEPRHDGITFSGLLNALDGVMAPSGRVVFMSTNHPELLDPALIRPGRVDIRVEFPNANSDQARQMFERFFADAGATAALAEQFANVMGDGTASMATIQGVLLESAGNPEAACLAGSEVEVQVRRADEGKPQPLARHAEFGAAQ